MAQVESLMALSKAEGLRSSALGGLPSRRRRASDRSSLRRIAHTPQSSLLGALHLIPCWWPGIQQNPLPLLAIGKLGGGFWPRVYGDSTKKQDICLIGYISSNKMEKLQHCPVRILQYSNSVRVERGGLFSKTKCITGRS